MVWERMLLQEGRPRTESVPHKLLALQEAGEAGAEGRKSGKKSKGQAAPREGRQAISEDAVFCSE